MVAKPLLSKMPLIEAHVWYANTHRCDAPEQLDYYRSLCNNEELKRLSRFAFPYLKVEYLVTRALCRLSLSRYVDVAPADWVFHTNAYGRPEIATPVMPALRFNLANARSLVACVVTNGVDVGIDVEERDRCAEALSIADQFFSPVELNDLRTLPKSAQNQRFFDLWTLKESYIKACGSGLAIPLSQFSLVFSGPGIGIRFTPPLRDEPTDWQFELHHPSDRHAMAVAIRKRSLQDFTIRWSEVVLQLPGTNRLDFPAGSNL